MPVKKKLKDIEIPKESKPLDQLIAEQSVVLVAIMKYQEDLIKLLTDMKKDLKLMKELDCLRAGIQDET